MATKGLPWKVYTATPREYVASTKNPEEAAILVAALGTGTQIKFEHHTPVWTEGEEEQPAGDSYDHVAEVCNARVNAQRAESLARFNEQQRQVPPGWVVCIKHDDGSQFGALVANSGRETMSETEILLGMLKGSLSYKGMRIVKMPKAEYEALQAAAGFKHYMPPVGRP